MPTSIGLILVSRPNPSPSWPTCKVSWTEPATDSESKLAASEDTAAPAQRSRGWPSLPENLPTVPSRGCGKTTAQTLSKPKSRRCSWRASVPRRHNWRSHQIRTGSGSRVATSLTPRLRLTISFGLGHRPRVPPFAGHGWG